MNKLWAVSLVFVVAVAGAAWADINVLVIGGSQPYRSSSEAAFPPSDVATHLEAILDGDSGVSQPVNLQWEDSYKIDSASGFMARTLMSWFNWPDTRSSTLALLRGDWDYVVMLDDPFVASTFPEYHLEGVQSISEEVRSSGGVPISVMLWSSGNTPISTFGEMAYRVGDGAEVAVAPAGYAWDNVNRKLKDSGTRPTTRGAYVTAATVYSQIFNRSAKQSSYIPSGLQEADRDSLADTAFSTVQAESTASHYSGQHVGPTHFSSPACSERLIEWADYNSSTEWGIRDAFFPMLNDISRVNYIKWPSPSYQSFPTVDHVIDFCESRFYDEADLTKWQNYATFDYMDDDGETTMIYGMDRVMYAIPNPEQETGASDVTPALISEGEFFVPVRVLWARVRAEQPDIPVQPDGHHMSEQLLNGISSMMYTLLSGRCPVGIEPADTASVDWQNWYCRKTGYEIAWQYATLNSRVPGFEVLPRDRNAESVGYNADETLTVRFLYPPRSNVTVNISLSDPSRAAASPAQLIFTPENYNMEQTVTVEVLPGTEIETSSSVQFDTISDDPAFDGLSDSWLYTFEYPVVPTLPFEDDFELLADGQEVAETEGWAGSGTGFLTDYSSEYSGAQPMPESNHTRVLDATYSRLMIESETDRPGVWFDSVVQFGGAGYLDQVSVPAIAQAWFGVDSNQQFTVYHAVDEGSDYSNVWTSLAQTPIVDQQWMRLTVEMSYATAGQSRSFFRVYLNSGNALTSSAAYVDRDDSAPAAGGTWFLCANQATSGSRMSEVRLNQVRCDDFVLTTNTVVVGDAPRDVAPFPFEDDFESLADGQAIAETNGWTGSGTGLLTDYSSTYTGAQPLPGSNHTRVLDATSSILSIESGADLSGVWFDSVVQFGAVGDLDQVSIPATAQAWFGIDRNQKFNVYHAVDEGSDYSNGWTSLAQTSIAAQQWGRLTVEMSYATAGQSRSFFRVYLNSGNALTSSAAYVDRDDSAPAAGGTWFLCANQATSGKRISEMQLNNVGCDDFVLSTEVVVIGNALDRDADGVPDWQEDIDGTDSANSASLLQIIGMNRIGNQGVFDFQAVAGKSYSVWFTSNLVDAVWQEITNGIPGVEPAATFTIEMEQAPSGFIHIETE